MPSGGARVRSGPKPDPNSQTSQRRGYTLRSLPPEGRKGRVPKYPLPPVEMTYIDEAGVVRSSDALSEKANAREKALWRHVWTLPQACAWESEPWRWYLVATWVRTAVICERSDAKAADRTTLLRLADQIGLTTAGLKENGWQIAKTKDSEATADKRESAPKSSRDRIGFKVISGGVG